MQVGTFQNFSFQQCRYLKSLEIIYTNIQYRQTSIPILINLADSFYIYQQVLLHLHTQLPKYLVVLEYMRKDSEQVEDSIIKHNKKELWFSIVFQFHQQEQQKQQWQSFRQNIYRPPDIVCYTISIFSLSPISISLPFFFFSRFSQL